MEVTITTKTKTIETTSPVERAFLIGTEIKGVRTLTPLSESLEELARLADTAGIEVVGQTQQSLDKPHVYTYFGSGKIEEI